MRNFYSLLIALLVSTIAISQTELLNEDLRGGSLPTDWTQTNVVFSSYARLESTSGVLTTLTINSSTHESVRVDFDVAKWGSGTNGPLLVEYSIDNGNNWLSAGNSTIPSNSDYQSNMIAINAVSSIMKIRFNNTSFSRKRLRDVIIYGIGTAPPTCTAPSTQATTYTTSSIASESATLNWVRGDGDNTLVVIKEGSAVDTNPTSGITYTANTMFSSGDELGTENYVVYNGTGTSEAITGLSENTTYHVAIYEYNNTDTCYNSTALTGSFSTLTNTRVQFISTLASVSEGVGTYNLEFSITNEDALVDTMFDVSLTTGNALDIDNYTTQSVTFAAGTNANQTVIVTVTDDAIFETDETLTFTIQNVTGGNNAVVGTNADFDLTITNNDVAPPIALPYNEDFSTCITAAWTAFNEAGDDLWTCSSGEYAINGFTGTDDLDWLISDFTIDFDAYAIVKIDVTTQEQFGNAVNEPGEFELRYSTDYTGSGDPTLATWTTLVFDPNNTSTSSGLSSLSTTTVDASSITGIAYLAFFYDMTAGSGAEDWRILDISIEETTDADTEIFAPINQIAGATVVAENSTAIGTAVDALDFFIEDQGTTDGQPTNVTTMRFIPGPNNTADWSDQIQGVTLLDGNLTNPITPTTVINITDTEITVIFDSPIIIPDNSSLEFILGFYLNSTNIIDGSIIQLQIDDIASGFVANDTGSTFIDPFTLGDVIGNNFTIDVDVTQLVFTQQPPAETGIGIAMTDVIVQAQDGNNNIDVDYNLDINITSTGLLASSPVTETAINGVATFSTITHTAAGTGLVLTADDTLFPTVISGSFDIVVLPTIIAIQDFDGTLPEWTYTNEIATFDNGWGIDGYYGIIDISSASPINNSSFSNNIFGENDLEDENDNGTAGFATTSFSNIDISNFTNVTLSFDWDIVGYNANNDDARYQVFYDGVGQGSVFLLDGNGSTETDEGSVSINIPDDVNDVSLLIEIRNNGANGYSGFDNFQLSGFNPSEIYAGNASTGFGGTLGSGNLQISASINGITNNIIFNRGAGDFNDFLVIYIDSESDGLTSTSSINDEADIFRKAISGRDGGNKSTINFPPGFTANYAISMENNEAALFRINSDGTLTFIRTLFNDGGLSTTEVSYPLTIDLIVDLGTTAGPESFKFVATYLNASNAFRSNEFIGDSNYGNDALVNPGHTAVDMTTYFQAASHKKGGEASSFASGPWTNSGSWVNGNAPLGGDEITINHDVIQNTNFSLSILNITGSNTLTINSGQKLTTFGGITGTGDLDIDGQLIITEGGFTNIIPTYSSGSTLEYKDIIGEYDRFNEWTDGTSVGAGVPDNVLIDNTTLDLTNAIQVSFVDFTIGSNLSMNGGSLTIDATESLTLGGNLSNSNGNLDLNSVSNDYSSLIVGGTSSGDVIYRRHVNTFNSTNGSTTGQNDLVSAPVTNASQTFFNFRTANANIPSGTIAGGPTTFYLFGPFDNDNAADPYVNYSTANDSDILTSGSGYRTASTDTSTFTFTGDVETGTVSVSINIGSAYEWNLIGNPYPSYINSGDFLTENAAALDEDAVGIYGYDGTALDDWTIINFNNMNEAENLAPGQGFMVAAESTTSLDFTPAMRRTSGNDDFIVGRNTDNNLHLSIKLENSNSNYHTDFYFNTNSTRALDPGYDAAIFNGVLPEFYMYSHLVENNEGRNMAIQSLGENDIANISIPLGVNANQGEAITFSINTSNLPDTVDIYLEDNITNTYTLLNSNDYTLTPNINLNGTGRFYLHVTNSALSNPENSLDNLSIYTNKSDKTIIVAGQLLDTTITNIYDIQGRAVITSLLQTASRSQAIDVSNLSAGVYVIQLINKTQSKTQKVILR